MYVDNTAVEVGHVFLLSVLDRRLILFILPRGTGCENIRSNFRVAITKPKTNQTLGTGSM
jgi:hypothetical protein